jgi:cytidylate kinase
MPNVLNIFIYAPIEERLKNCVEQLGMDETSALEKIRKVDDARSAYRHKFCPECVSEFDDRHIMIDSSKFGVEGTANILTEIVKSSVGK